MAADEETVTTLRFNAPEMADSLFLLDLGDGTLTPVVDGLGYEVKGSAYGRLYLTSGLPGQSPRRSLEWKVKDDVLTVYDLSASGGLSISVYDTLGSLSGFSGHFRHMIILLCHMPSLRAYGEGCAVSADATAGKGVAVLTLDIATLDLGTIPADTITEAEAGFINSGDAPLILYSIFSECGCTATTYPTEPVSPGSIDKIRIRFNPKNRKPGPFRKVLRIRSNPSEPRTLLIVEGEVRK